MAEDGNVLFHNMARFWTRIFALTFAIGVATGIVMEFEFGTNWATYSRFVGDIFGSALAAEGFFAFFLESGFPGGAALRLEQGGTEAALLRHVHGGLRRALQRGVDRGGELAGCRPPARLPSGNDGQWPAAAAGAGPCGDAGGSGQRAGGDRRLLGHGAQSLQH